MIPGFTADVEILPDRVIKRFKANIAGHRGTNLRGRAERWLKVMHEAVPEHVPAIIDARSDVITMEYRGEPVTLDTVPADADHQAATILDALEAAGCVHRDIRPGNVLVQGGTLTLVDFVWAEPAASGNAQVAPRGCGCLGGNFRHPDRYDDRFSFGLLLDWLRGEDDPANYTHRRDLER